MNYLIAIFFGIAAFIIAMSVTACGNAGSPICIDEMERSIREFIEDKDARIGVAVIIDGTDTLSIDGYESFPMLSVYKFPQALVVADFCRANDISFSDSIDIEASEIKTGTWSPLRTKYGY